MYEIYIALVSLKFLKHNTNTVYHCSFENETHNFKVYDSLYEVHADLAVLTRSHSGLYWWQSTGLD
jgi:hypothetical protein